MKRYSPERKEAAIVAELRTRFGAKRVDNLETVSFEFSKGAPKNRADLS